MGLLHAQLSLMWLLFGGRKEDTCVPRLLLGKRRQSTQLWVAHQKTAWEDETMLR